MLTLTSDFPAPYPAAMKGVVRARTDAELVDVAHDLPRQDVRTAAFWCREVFPYFPPAVHLVVVDPGVGTDRAALAIRAGDHALVGPDNGVLVPVIRELVGADPGASVLDLATVAAYEINVEDPASATFHGRDVFAPAAADVHEVGVDGMAGIERLDPTDDFVDLWLPDPVPAGDGYEATVLAVDGFGNVITNVPGDWLDGREHVSVDGERVPVARSYAHVEPGQALATVGSHGRVELAVDRGRGDEAFGLGAGDEVGLDPID